MDNSVSIIFGIPKHGWLPVDFRYQDFHLDFGASDVLNDPIEELFNSVTKIQDNEERRIIWWCEPEAYYFDFVKKGEDFTLNISETDDLHNHSADIEQLIRITGGYKEIIEPFRIALRQFSSQTYEENHWPYKLDKNETRSL